MKHTNNSTFIRVLAMLLCFIMTVGTLSACFNEVEFNDGLVEDTNTETDSSTTITTPGNGSTSDKLENDPVENPEDDPVEDPIDPNEIFSASTELAENSLILGALANGVTIGDYANVGAIVPADVKVEAGASSLDLLIKSVEEVLDIFGDAELVQSLDVHVSGVAADNKVPMIVNLGAILEAGLGATELKLYHMEDGVAVLMTRVASINDFAIHNQYVYNEETGEVTIYVASFSLFTAVRTEADKWDGTSNIDWYVGNEDTYTLTSAEEFAGFRDLVDQGNTFEGKTVKLGVDIDLDGKLFDPIGKDYVHLGGQAFMGTFDGCNHTIYGVYQNGWELGYDYGTQGGGLFASVQNATIKNLVVSNANIVMECIDMGIVVGYAQGTCYFENIIVTNSTIANYNRATGGVVGEVTKGVADKNGFSHTFRNILVDSSVVVSSLWGSFDTLCGGVIGGKWGDAIVLMDNVKVAAELDVYSDVTAAYQWYAYRRCGMLIGYTEQESPKKADHAHADFLTCENVNVYYGDWVNYNYYEFENQDNDTGKRYPWVRAEESPVGNNGAFSNPRYGVPTHGGVKVTEDPNMESLKTDYTPIVFNQLYGGGQGVYGTNEHAENRGVTIHNSLKKTIIVTSNCTNLKLYYWFANGDDAWTTLIEGIDMSTMLVEGNTYKIELPAYAHAFKIIADEATSEDFVLENLESDEIEFNKPCTHEYDNACDTTCNVCNAEREVTHTPGAAATCTTAQTCTVCGTELVKELGHTEVVDKAVAATCTTAGKTEGKHCSVCNTVLVAQKTVAALGHDWKADPYKCSRCGLVAEKKTVYFQNNWNWSDVRVYYWLSDGSYNVPHPGVQMTLDHNDGTYDIYKFDLPAYADGFNISGIKNNGSGERDQTPDIKVSDVSSDYFYYMNYNNGNEVKRSPKVVYLVLDSTGYWQQSSARFAVYFFNNTTGKNTWVSMTWDATKKAYKCNVPDGQWEGMIYCRMNPSTSANNWNNKWNQTGDLTIPNNGNNCGTLKITNSGNWDGSTTVSWSKK